MRVVFSRTIGVVERDEQGPNTVMVAGAYKNQWVKTRRPLMSILLNSPAVPVIERKTRMHELTIKHMSSMVGRKPGAQHKLKESTHLSLCRKDLGPPGFKSGIFLL